MKKEIWKDVVGYEDIYQVSNKGRVKSLNRVIKCFDSNGDCTYTHQIKSNLIKIFPDKVGYQKVVLIKNKKYKQFLAHRIVAFAHIPNPDSKPFINHIDSDKSNNNVENLEWCTSAENNQHAYDTGQKTSWFTTTDMSGVNNPTAKTVKCTKTCGSVNIYPTLTEASLHERVSITSICNNLRGRSKTCGNKLKFEYV